MRSATFFRRGPARRVRCSLCPPRNVRAPSNQRHERLHQDRDAWKFHHRLAQKVPNGKSFSRNSWLRRGCTYARRIRWFGSTSISASRISTARATSHQAGAYVAAPGACERTVTPPWTGPVRHASQQARDVCLVAASERARAYVWGHREPGGPEGAAGFQGRRSVNRHVRVGYRYRVSPPKRRAVLRDREAAGSPCRTAAVSACAAPVPYAPAGCWVLAAARGSRIGSTRSVLKYLHLSTYAFHI
jgi:hypothetical protein